MSNLLPYGANTNDALCSPTGRQPTRWQRATYRITQKGRDHLMALRVARFGKIARSCT